MQAREHRLGLWVTETTVELEHPGTGVGDHEPRVENPVIRGSPAAHDLNYRLVHRGGDLLDECGVEAGHRRVAAHSARVRPLVPIEDALVVLGRRERNRILAVAERKERELLAI